MSQLNEHLKNSKTDFLMFSQTICTYCSIAKRYLKNKGLSYTEINLDHHDGLRKELVIETGHRTVPVLFDLRGDEIVFVGGSDNLIEYKLWM